MVSFRIYVDPAQVPQIQAIARGNWLGKPAEFLRSSGYVVHMLEAPLFAVLKAAILGNDADAVGVLSGALLMDTCSHTSSIYALPGGTISIKSGTSAGKPADRRACWR